MDEDSFRNRDNIHSHLESLFNLRHVPPEGRQLIREGLSGLPVREVQGQRGNVLTCFFSRKMQRQVMLESRRGEWAQAVLLENDSDALAYFAQPFTVNLTLEDGDRIVSRQNYTPDFLIIRRDSIEVREVRDDVRLAADAARSERYRQDAQGNWIYQPALDYFTRMGVDFRIVGTSSLPAPLIANLRFLEGYSSPNAIRDEDALASLKAIVAENRAIELRTLAEKHGVPADTIFRAIVDADVYVDLAACRLDRADTVVVATSKSLHDMHRILKAGRGTPVLPIPGCLHFAPGTRLVFDGNSYTVVVCGENDVVLRRDGMEDLTVPVALLKSVHQGDPGALSSNTARQPPPASLAGISTAEAERAMLRFDCLRTDRRAPVSRSTLYRYRAKAALATTPPDVLLSLVDRVRHRGNRLPKLPARSIALAHQVIRSGFNTPDKRSKKSVYGAYSALCLAESERRMSYPSFCKHCDDLLDVRKREGKRAAYQQRPIPHYLDNSLPIHGCYPHEICYIDHTIVSIATKTPEDVDLGKPTLTLAVDGSNSKTRAFILTYMPPSASLVLLVLRDYVRRHNRLPRVLSVDNGKEFHSRELKFFCKMYGIDIRYRPPGMPRGGAMVERAIGVVETELMANLEGNTKQMKDPRLVTQSVNPFLRARWTLPALHGALDEFLFDVRHNRIHPALGVPPNQYEEKQFQMTGRREHNLVSFDENLILMTSPHAKKPYHTVNRTRGIWCNGLYYWHPDLAKVKKGVSCEVRIELWDVRVIYVNLGSRWVAAISRDLRHYHGKTTYEVEVAAREAKRLAALRANQDTTSADQLAKRGRLLDPTLFDSRLASQQQETSYLLQRLEMVSREVNVEVEASPGDGGLAVPWDATELPSVEVASPALKPDMSSPPEDPFMNTRFAKEVGAIDGLL